MSLGNKIRFFATGLVYVLQLYQIGPAFGMVSPIDIALQASEAARKQAAREHLYGYSLANPQPDDTVQNRANLYSLGKKLEQYGPANMSPEEMNQFTQLSKQYNFPRFPDSPYEDREAEDSATIDYMQKYLGEKALSSPVGYYRGGKTSAKNTKTELQYLLSVFHKHGPAAAEAALNLIKQRAKTTKSRGMP